MWRRWGRRSRWGWKCLLQRLGWDAGKFWQGTGGELADQIEGVVVGAGKLTLSVPEGAAQAFVAQSLLTATYMATVGVMAGDGGLGLIGDAQDDVVLSRRTDGVEVWQRDRAGKHTVWPQGLKLNLDEKVWLRVASTKKGEARVCYRVGDCKWREAGERVELKSLLPWDPGLRVGLVVEGANGGSAKFVRFAVGATE